MMTSPHIGIVVVNFGSHRLLRENLVPLDLAALNAAVIVVDNFSSAEERSSIATLCAENDWKLSVAQNAGFGAGVNRGVAEALALGCSAFVLLNPDLKADTRALAALASVVDRDHTVMACPDIRFPNGSHWFSGGAILLGEGSITTKPGTDSAVGDGWLSGACLVVHQELWTRLGGFDESYFLYWEDVDLSWRCRRAGGRLMVRNDIRVTHSVGGTQSDDPEPGTIHGGERHHEAKSPIYYYYNCRNRLLFAARNLPRRTKLRWLASTPGYALRILRRDGWRASMRHPWRTVWPVLRGSLRGIVMLVTVPSSVPYTLRSRL